MLTAEMQKVLENYNKGLELYKQKEWDKAMEFFKAALQAKPNDGPSKLYVERCQHFSENPPPADWDGVFTMTSK